MIELLGETELLGSLSSWGEKTTKKKEEPPTWAEVEGSWALSEGRGRNLTLIVKWHAIRDCTDRFQF